MLIQKAGGISLYVRRILLIVLQPSSSNDSQPSRCVRTECGENQLQFSTHTLIQFTTPYHPAVATVQTFHVSLRCSYSTLGRIDLKVESGDHGGNTPPGAHACLSLAGFHPLKQPQHLLRGAVVKFLWIKAEQRGQGLL